MNYLQNEFAASWCAGQVPRAAPRLDGRLEYSCVDMSSGLQGMTVGEDPTSCSVGDASIDCGKLFLCVTAPVPVCECGPERCAINTDLRPTVQLRRQGDELVGMLGQGAFIGNDGQLTTLGEVRFRRGD